MVFCKTGMSGSIGSMEPALLQMEPFAAALVPNISSSDLEEMTQALKHSLGLLEFQRFTSFIRRRSLRVMPLSFRHNPENSLLGQGNHDMVHKVVMVRDSIRVRGTNMHKNASEKLSIRKCHDIAFGHTFHSLGKVASEIELFSNGETIEHIGETSIGKIFVSHETYDVFTKNDFRFFEVDLQLENGHLEGIKSSFYSFDLTGLTGRSLIKKSITDQEGILMGRWIDIRI
ncbi:hypothetical protein Tco_0059467 [Tanacetum coccineum]